MDEVIDTPIENELDDLWADLLDAKILVVDDSATIRELLRKYFSKRDIVVEVAGNADQALELLEKSSFPVMFFDLNMPGMNGVELCRQAHNDHPLSVIYAMTGFVSLFALSECRDAGFEDYFIKPIDLKLFHHAIDEAFAKIKRWSTRLR